MTFGMGNRRGVAEVRSTRFEQRYLDPQMEQRPAGEEAPRVRDFMHADLETALYERRSVVRMLGMRRTMFVVPLDLAAVMDEACTKALAPPQRRRLVAMLEEQGVARDGARWLRRV